MENTEDREKTGPSCPAEGGGQQENKPEYRGPTEGERQKNDIPAEGTGNKLKQTAGQTGEFEDTPCPAEGDGHQQMNRGRRTQHLYKKTQLIGLQWMDKEISSQKNRVIWTSKMKTRK